MERFQQYLREQGLSFTSQRRVIADVFLASKNEHLSLGDLLELAKSRQSSIGYATVYRTMKLMADSGVAHEHKFGEEQVRYEPAVEGEHHDHIICADCGLIVEFEDDLIETRQVTIARENGFNVASHRHQIYGECTFDPCHRRADGPKK